jgi:hypothetical protein
MEDTTRPLVFMGVPEPFVDQILEHLSQSRPPLSRCFVFGSSMQLLGVLVDQWKARVEIIAVFLDGRVEAAEEAAELILEAEGCKTEAAVWVCDRARAHTPEGVRIVDADSTSTAAEIARQVAAVLSP